MTNTTTPAKCPHCGEPEVNGPKNYACGTSWINAHADWEQSDLCRERETRQKAESEASRLKEMLDWTRRDSKKGLALADEWAEKCASAENNLRRVIEIAENYTHNVHEIKELNAIKATLPKLPK